MTDPIIPVTHDDVVLIVAKALAAALKRSCTNARGECYAVTDESIAYDGDMVAEVDGEISLLALAEAAIAALPTIGSTNRQLQLYREALLEAKLARLNWQKYNKEQSDEIVYQAEKMATAIDKIDKALEGSCPDVVGGEK